MHIYIYIFIICIYIEHIYHTRFRVLTTEFCPSVKEPCISTKEPCISAKGPCISAKEPCISKKEPRISATNLANPTNIPSQKNFFLAWCTGIRKKNKNVGNNALYFRK